MLTGANLITTQNYTWLGEVEKEDHRFVYLRQASRIFMDGRFGEFVRTGTHENAEWEHAGEAIVRIPHGAIVDIVEWKHALPTGDQ